MSSLQAFLNPAKIENKKVIISNRFVEDGKPVPFVIRPISEKENEQLLKKYAKKDKRTGQEILDRTAYSHALVARAVVFPDLKNAELQKAYGVLGEVELLNKMLTIGEFATLSEAVSELSGLDEDINQDIEEAKNE
ncbi:MAG: Phage portal protein [Thermoanaerobacterium thermosaccharolyticum]|jgi:hypothetical protein